MEMAQKFDFREDDHDYYSQPGNLFRMFSPEEKQRLFANTFAPSVRPLRRSGITMLRTALRRTWLTVKVLLRLLKPYSQSRSNPPSASLPVAEGMIQRLAGELTALSQNSAFGNGTFER
jgi:Catalase-related immune-responsive